MTTKTSDWRGGLRHAVGRQDTAPIGRRGATASGGTGVRPLPYGGKMCGRPRRGGPKRQRHPALPGSPVARPSSALPQRAAPGLKAGRTGTPSGQQVCATCRARSDRTSRIGKGLPIADFVHGQGPRPSYGKLAVRIVSVFEAWRRGRAARKLPASAAAFSRTAEARAVGCSDPGDLSRCCAYVRWILPHLPFAHQHVRIGRRDVRALLDLRVEAKRLVAEYAPPAPCPEAVLAAALRQHDDELARDASATDDPVRLDQARVATLVRAQLAQPDRWAGPTGTGQRAGPMD